MRAFYFLACAIGCGANNVVADGGLGDANAVDAFEQDANASDAGDASDANAATPPTEVTLLGCPQAGYAGAFTIGGAPFELVVDTGSAELGVASSTCANCNVSPLYTPGATATDENATLSVSYVSGSGWSGEIIEDEFGVAKASIAAPTRLVAIQSQSGGFFDNDGCDFGDTPFAFQGVAGFGPDSLAKAGTDEPMGALANHGVADVFAFALCGSGGQLWLGGLDASIQNVTYTPLLNSDNYYGIRVNDLSVGTTSLNLTSSSLGDVIVDTDTTELELPTSVYTKLRDAIAASSYFQAHFGTSGWFDSGYCTPPLDASPPSLDAIDAGLPALTLAVDDGANGSFNVTLGATDSYMQPIRKNNVLYYCPEIEESPTSSTVLGSAAMRGLYVVIDRAQNRVGFAPHTTCAAP